MDYESMSLAELKEIAKEKKVGSISGKKKADIIEILHKVDEMEAAEKLAQDLVEANKDVPSKEALQRKEVAPRELLRPAEKFQNDEKLQAQERPQMLERKQPLHPRTMADKPYPSQQEYRPNYQQPNNRLQRPQTPNTQYRPNDRQQPGQLQNRQQFQGQNVQFGQQYAPQPNQQPQYQQPQYQQPQYQQPQYQQPQYQQPQPQQNQPQQQYTQTQPNTDILARYANTDYNPYNDPYYMEIAYELDSGIEKNGIFELNEGFGFIRCDNFLPGAADVYVSNQQIRRYGLRDGDIICGNLKVQGTEKFPALLYIKNINGYSIQETLQRQKFENLTPVFPHERIHLETPESSVAMRMVDLVAPIGKGQRGMIVSQPKSGKTTLLKGIANSITTNHPDMHLIILLIDERPEEVTDIKESIHGGNVEVIYSTFDELPDNHRRVSEMVIERAKRLVEYGEDVVILLDSITRLARAYNLTCVSSGRTLSGGLDPAALHMPKKFFGAARTMREGGSLTILATALVETGSRMDDVVFEEFKGTGNMELVLDRNLSERRIFPAIDLAKSGTRRDDLLLGDDEREAMNIVRRALNGPRPEEITESLVNMCAHTRNNQELVNTIKKTMGRQ